jgi:hypothetical protein
MWFGMLICGVLLAIALEQEISWNRTALYHWFDHQRWDVV